MRQDVNADVENIVRSATQVLHHVYVPFDHHEMSNAQHNTVHVWNLNLKDNLIYKKKNKILFKKKVIDLEKKRKRKD